MDDRVVRQDRNANEIVVPASIGNLGPGFDTLSLAVSLYLRIRVARRIDDGRGRLLTRFIDAPPRGQNRIDRAFAAMPARKASLPSLEIEVRSNIPQRAGLGSSAAATIAGLRLRALVDGRRPVGEILDVASRLERHPDNAAAALYGGLTSSCVASSGHVNVGRWDWPPSWRVVVATPEAELSTAESRRSLPSVIPLADAVFNFQRLSQLLAAVQSRSAADLAGAFEDRCHQPYRTRLVPALRRALALKHPDVLGICLAGAGPSVVMFARRNLATVAGLLQAVYEEDGRAVVVRTLRVHEERKG
ncbi:MAG: homoserine kinase [Vicinamibacterales bacterium]